MSSGRRSQAHLNSEQRRKAQGKIVRAVAAAASSTTSLRAAQDEAAANTEAEAASQTAPVLILPPTLAAIWDASRIVCFTATDTACIAATSALLQSHEMAAQFMRIHSLAHTIIDAAGGDTKGKKGAKKPVAAAAPASAAADPAAASALSPAVRAVLLDGLVELLCVKLHAQARAPMYLAIESLDAVVDGSSLLSLAVDRALVRLAASPLMAHVIQFEQLSSFPRAFPTLAAQPLTVLRGVQRAVDEIVLKGVAGGAAAAGAASTEANNGEDEDEEVSSSQQASSASAAQWMSPSDQTRFLLRSAVGYILKYRKEVQELFVVAQTNVAAPNRAELCMLVQTISRVLRSSQAHRDVLTQCGLIIAVLLHVSASASVPVKSGAESLDVVMTQSIFATYFAEPGKAIQQSLLRAIPALGWLHSDSESAATAQDAEIQTRSFEQQLQTLARLSCARSIISHSSLGVLLAPTQLSSSQPETLLLTHLVPAVLGHCKSINPHIRAYSLQTLDVILIRVKAFIATALAPPKDASVASSAPAPSPLLPHFSALLSSILDLLHSNFDHPFKAIPGIVKGLFIGFIDVTNQLRTLSQGAGQDKQQIEADREKHWRGFIGNILHRESAKNDKDAAASASDSSAQGPSFHTSSRGVLTMLSVLLSQVRVVSLLQSHPSLLPSLFQAGQFRPMFGLSTHLVEMILLQAKNEGVTAPKTKEDAAAAASVGEEGASAAASNSRSRQKQRKDVIKQRMQAKAAEIEAVAAGEAPAAPSVVGLPPAASASSSMAPSSAAEPNPLYLSQLASWRALWTPHVVAALLSSNALWRSDVAGGTLSHLLKNVDTESDALAHVLQAIQAVQIGSAAVANEAAIHGDSHVIDARREGSLRQLRALVVVLKIARRIGLVTSRDLDTRIRRDGEIGEMAALAPAAPIMPTSPVALTRDSFLPITSSQLFAALLHTDLDLRLDVFEFLCSNLQSAEPLSALELGLVRAGLPYLLKAGAPPVRAKFVHCIQRILIRLRDGVHREIREDMAVRDRVAANASAAAASASVVVTAPVAASIQIKTDSSESSAAQESALSPPHLVGVISPPALTRVAPAFRFFNFFEQFLFDSLYPSAPFERATAALELYKVLVEAFLTTAPLAATAAAVDSAASSSTSAGWATSAPVSDVDVWHLRSTLFTREKTCVLINLLASNHERVRLLAFELIERFPAPLPSFEHVRPAVTSSAVSASSVPSSSPSSSSLLPLLRWAMTLCRSPRMRDAEGGALALKLIFKKYVVGLRWCIDYSALARSSATNGSAQSSDEYAPFVVAPNAQESILFFFDSLLAFIQFQLSVINSSDISVRYADPNSRLHGSLLLFRLLVVDVPWSFWNRCGDAVKSRWIAFTSEMVSTLIRVAEVSLSLHIPTNAAAALRGSGGNTTDAQDARPSTSVNMDCRGHVILPASQQPLDDQPEGTSSVGGGDDWADHYGEQIVVVSSWLAVKEVALSLGEWVCTAPLPSSASAASATAVTVSSPFTIADLRRIGSLFFAILSCSKHNGVLENSHEGFLAVVAALLEKHDATLSALVAEWLTQLLEMIAQPWLGESWIRRSRGVAYCLLAILQAEPASSKQPVSEQEVMAIVDSSANATSIDLLQSSVVSSSMLGRCMIQLMRMAQVETGPAGSADYDRGWQLKVHGLNILRALFRDSCLAVDAMPYIAPALSISILGFAHSSWAVRNSSLITFGALLSKAVRAQVRTSVGSSPAVSAASADDAGSNVGVGSVHASGMTALDFFAHFPTLHPFLLEQLTQATRGMGETPIAQQKEMLEKQHAATSSSKDVDAPDWGAAMHPSLYPVLLLLSRLIPSPTADSTAAASSSTRLDTHAFLPLIRACSSHPYWQARFMAAKAVVSLVAVGQLRAYLHEIVDALIAAGKQEQVHHNQMHGLLLQMETLMRFHHVESTLLSPQDKHALASSLLPLLLSSTGSARWLGVESRMSCAPIRLLFLQVVELCVEYVEAPAVSAPIVGTPVDALAAKARQQLLLLTAQACDVRSAAEADFIGIGVDGLRASAVAMLVRCLCCLDPAAIAESPADLTGLILSLLRDSVDGPVPSLMLLEQLLWSLHRAFTLHGGRLSALLDLPAIARWLLRDHLVRFSSCFATSPKTNHSILQLGLQLVHAVWMQQQQRGQLIPDAPGDAQQAVRIEDHWTEFLTYTTQAVDVAAKSAAFQCLAACLDIEMSALRKQMRDDGEAAVTPALRGFLHHACTFIELLESFMDDEQPVLLRYACVQAIQHSGLLKPAVLRLGLSLPKSDAAVTHAAILPAPSRSSPSTSPLLSLPLAFRSIAALHVRLWCSPLLHLLSDENDSVRVDASNLIGGLVELNDDAWARLAGTAADEISPSIHSGQILVARVLDQSLFFLESRFHAEPSLAQSLQQLMRFFTLNFESTWDNAASSKGSAAVLEQPASSSPTSTGAPLKLFEHEKPNTVIEEPMIIEIASRVYSKLIQRQAAALSKDELAQFTSAVTADCAWWVSGLQSALDSVSSSDGAVWIGGASFMEQQFVRIFGFALGVRCTAVIGGAGAGNEALDSLISRVLDSMHPMLQRMLLSVLTPPASRLVGIELNPGPSKADRARARARQAAATEAAATEAASSVPRTAASSKDAPPKHGSTLDDAVVLALADLQLNENLSVALYAAKPVDLCTLFTAEGTAGLFECLEASRSTSLSLQNICSAMAAHATETIRRMDKHATQLPSEARRGASDTLRRLIAQLAVYAKLPASKLLVQEILWNRYTLEVLFPLRDWVQSVSQQRNNEAQASAEAAQPSEHKGEDTEGNAKTT